MLMVQQMLASRCCKTDDILQILAVAKGSVARRANPKLASIAFGSPGSCFRICQEPKAQTPPDAAEMLEAKDTPPRRAGPMERLPGLRFGVLHVQRDRMTARHPKKSGRAFASVYLSLAFGCRVSACMCV